MSVLNNIIFLGTPANKGVGIQLPEFADPSAGSATQGPCAGWRALMADADGWVDKSDAGVVRQVRLDQPKFVTTVDATPTVIYTSPDLTVIPVVADPKAFRVVVSVVCCGTVSDAEWGFYVRNVIYTANAGVLTHRGTAVSTQESTGTMDVTFALLGTTQFEIYVTGVALTSIKWYATVSIIDNYGNLVD